MNPKWRRFAPIGLYLALVAVLASITIYFVQREWNLYLQISLALIVIGLAIYAILDPDGVRKALTGRQVKYGSNTLLFGAAFVGILIVINYLAYQNPVRKDLTEDQVHTLAPETIATLDELDSEVMALAFYTPRIGSDQAKDILEQYKLNAEGNFDYGFIDPDADPIAAEQAKISRDGTVVLRMDDHQEVLTMVNEQELTGALVRLLNPEERKVYFLTGHGEYNPEDTGEAGYSQVKRTLESKNYAVETLNLLTIDQIPEDAKVVLVAGPSKPVSPAEVKKISEYLDSGGGLFVMQEPLPATDFGDEPDPLADYLAEKWGIVLGDDIIIDLASTQPYAPFAAEYVPHSITAKLERLTAQFPTVRSVQVQASESGLSQVEIVKTGPQSWAEEDMDLVVDDPQGASFEEGQDTPGPLSIAAVGEKFGTESRLVVFGDSDFASDANFFAYANGDLFINSIDWAAGQEDLINLTPKPPTQRIMIPLQQITLNLILLSTVIILPGMALLAGFFVWFQRRQRG